jgi:O-antigen/teichoic acid export membrane protein
MISAYQTTFLTAARRQAQYSAWVATESWLKPCAALLIIWLWQPSVDAILVGYIIGFGLALMIFYRPYTNPVKRYSGKTLPKQPQLMRQIIRYAIPLFPLALVTWISTLSDRYIIAGLLDYKAVGIYAAAYSIAFQPFLIAGGIVELTIRPVYFNAISNRDDTREATAIKSWLILTAMVSMFGIILIFFYHKWIADLLLGSDFRQASVLMPWLSVGGGLFAIGQVLEKPFYGHMQTPYVLRTQLWGASASIAFCFLLISTIGIIGAAIAVPIYYGFQCLVAIYYNWKMLKSSV